MVHPDWWSSRHGSHYEVRIKCFMRIINHNHHMHEITIQNTSMYMVLVVHKFVVVRQKWGISSVVKTFVKMGEGDDSDNIVMFCPSRCFECWHVDRWDSSTVLHVFTCSDLFFLYNDQIALARKKTSFLVLVLVLVRINFLISKNLEYKQYWKTVITLKSLSKIKRYKVKAMSDGNIKRYWQVTCSIINK